MESDLKIGYIQSYLKASSRPKPKAFSLKTMPDILLNLPNHIQTQHSSWYSLGMPLSAWKSLGFSEALTLQGR